jgi:hypothetical protein
VLTDSSNDIEYLFKESAEKVAKLMTDQIDASRSGSGPTNLQEGRRGLGQSRRTVDASPCQKVVLMGGYGLSQSLFSLLQAVVSPNTKYHDVELLQSRMAYGSAPRPQE